VVDDQHLAKEQGRYTPYVVDAGVTVVVDASKYTFRDPGRLLRAPNTLRLIYDNGLYAASWPARGQQVLTLDTTTLTVRQGEAFKGFAAGKQAYVAIGFEEPADGGEVTFTAYWIGSMLFR
jgi:hypothetical protein